MRIEKIVELKADRKHKLVVFEGGVRFFCPSATLKEVGLNEGDDADPDELKARAGEEERRLAEEIAVRKLSFAPRSEKEIRASIFAAHISADAALDAVEKMERYNYLDDERFARDYITYRGKKLGRKRLEYELTAVKGVDRDLVRGLIEELTSDDEELKKAKDAAEKFCSARVMSSKNAGARLLNHLSYRGFDAKTVFSVKNEMFKRGNDTDNDAEE
ncbi:MAG: recombination regulator RecX [Clostridiales bacterium]|jgi:regulatory protein|nr:recombination regulator RecX [Clostridiales bacterium]